VYITRMLNSTDVTILKQVSLNKTIKWYQNKQTNSQFKHTPYYYCLKY